MAAILAAGVLLNTTAANALQTMVTSVDKNADGTMTYHFAVKTDPEETLVPGTQPAQADFVTIYNFYGLVNGSAKAPAGWQVTSEEFGRTPTRNGYPMVLPLDVPNTPNLTWTVTKPVMPNTTVEGFSATTRVGPSVEGEYAAQVTRHVAAVPGLAGSAAMEAKQATIGTLPGPSFLAPTTM